MARPIPDLDQMTAAEVATDDSIIIDDTSAGETKRINVGALLGLPVVGWTSSGEVHTFVSFDSTTRIGIITVPTNATTKYQVGNRYRLTQATGGTKYAIIHAVAATQLTLFFPLGTTLNNETINNPYYSQLDSPIGFDKNPELWSLIYRKTTRTTQLSVSLSTWYNLGGSLAIGVGKWLLSVSDMGLQTHASSTYSGFSSALGTTSSGGILQDTRRKSNVMSDATTEVDDMYAVDLVPYTAASPTTLYLLRGTGTGSAVALYSEQTTDQFTNAIHYIKALSAYL